MKYVKIYLTFVIVLAAMALDVFAMASTFCISDDTNVLFVIVAFLLGTPLLILFNLFASNLLSELGV